MNGSPESNESGSPMRHGGMGGATTRQPSRMKQDLRSSAVTPFMTGRLGSLGATNNATINETDNIKVAVRVRPLFPDKVDKDSISVLQVSDDHNMVKVVVPGPAGNKMQRDFQFHACLGPEVSQSDVLHLCGIPQLLDAALSGYNVTIFAYGQTGSGKTYTMSGREEVISQDEYQGDTHDGIMTRSVSYLYQQIKERKECKVQLSASYLEIYNEAVFDLLTSRSSTGGGGLVGGRPAFASKDLGIKWDPAQGFFVPGLKVMPCKSIDSMMEVIRLGMKHRHVGSHQLNMESSRSHSIMTIHCSAMSMDQSSWDYGTPRFGKICFVDLAGSERLKDSKSEGAMLKETTNINKSLFVLGKVISALAERDAAGVSTAHIPYRDSKLTKLLMDSLGGSAMALMIACCSPSMNHVEETLSTLSYATRAKNIQNRPIVQYDPKEAQIIALRREIELLRQENQYLREQIRSAGGYVPATPIMQHGSSSNEYTSGISDTPMTHGSSQLITGRPDWPILRGRELPGTPQHLLPTTPGSALHSANQSLGNSGNWGNPQDSMYDAVSQRLAMRMSSNPQGSSAFQPALTSSNGSIKLRPQAHLQLMEGSSVNGTGDDGSAFGGQLAEDGGTQGEEGGFQLGHLRAGSGAGWRGSQQPLPGHTHGGGGHSHTSPDELAQRLKDTQGLLAKFSAENGRLAKENDRLRMTRAIMGSEHAGVLDEIEALRSQLSGLESAVLAGNASPSAAKALLTTLRQTATFTGNGANSPTTSMPPSRDLPRTAQSVYTSQADLLGLLSNATAGNSGIPNNNLYSQASRFFPDQANSLSAKQGLSRSWSRNSDELDVVDGSVGQGAEDGDHGAPWGVHGSGASAALHIRTTADIPLSAHPQPPPDTPNRRSSFTRQTHGTGPTGNGSQSGFIGNAPGMQGRGSLPDEPFAGHMDTPSWQQTANRISAGDGTAGAQASSTGYARPAEVLNVSGTPGSAARSRQPSYGEPPPTAKGKSTATEGTASGGIIVANQAKLALLLGNGPAAPVVGVANGPAGQHALGNRMPQGSAAGGMPPKGGPPGQAQQGRAAPGQLLAGTGE